MPRFAFEARDGNGRSVSGFESALDEFELDRRLADSDLLLVRAHTAKARRAGGRVSARALIDFCYHLSVIVEGGLPLLQGLRDLEQDADASLAEAISQVADRVEAGAGLSEALGDRPREFPQLIRALVAAGERTGALDRILKDLVRYLEWREDLSRQLRSAATYPIIVISGVFALCVLIATVVLPSFLDIFVDLGVELPASTRALIAARSFLSVWGLHLGIALFAAGIGLVAAVRTPPGRRRLHATLLRVPVLGRLIMMLEASRFSHNLGVLYASGLPILECLILVEEIVQNLVVRERLSGVKERVSAGDSLAASIAQSGTMPTMVNRMVSIGEATGKLDEALERAAAFYDREVPELIARALALFNTGAIVFLGAALAGIALSLFVPLYSMLGSLNG